MSSRFSHTSSHTHQTTMFQTQVHSLKPGKMKSSSLTRLKNKTPCEYYCCQHLLNNCLPYELQRYLYVSVNILFLQQCWPKKSVNAALNIYFLNAGTTNKMLFTFIVLSWRLIWIPHTTLGNCEEMILFCLFFAVFW